MGPIIFEPVQPGNSAVEVIVSNDQVLAVESITLQFRAVNPAISLGSKVMQVQHPAWSVSTSNHHVPTPVNAWPVVSKPDDGDGSISRGQCKVILLPIANERKKMPIVVKAIHVAALLSAPDAFRASSGEEVPAL